MLPSVEDRAYLAGLFDGEGCISASPKRNGIPGARVSIAQKDPFVLAWVQEILGFGNVYQGKANGCSYWVTEKSADIKSFAALVYPYSRVKTNQIQIGYALADAVPTRSQAQTATEEMKVTNAEERIRLANALQELKS